MIAFFAAIAAAASPAPPAAPAADPARTRCAFETAEKLALASEEAAASIADRVVTICSAEAPMTDAGRQFIRAAALAMIERRRGLDDQPADAPLRIAVPQNSLDIPDEIAPAIVPYFRCLLASAGQTEKSGGRVVPPPKGIAKGSDCAAFRKQAARNADRMLRVQGGRSSAERKAFIEKALQEMDAVPLGPPAPLEKSTEDGAGVANQPILKGTSSKEKRV
jgi:hypothetical protein